MRINRFNTDKNVLVIAEIGNNHEGNPDTAEKMILEAAAAGADAVKFQTFKTELFIDRNNTARFERLKSFELSQEVFMKLYHVAQKAGVLFLSTPFDLESAEFLNKIVPAFKIASADNNFFPLLQFVAGTGKPVIISSGLVDINEIRHSKNYIETIWNNRNINGELAVLHCVTSYPTLPEDANLNAIRHLQKEFGCTIGYSDHTMGTTAVTAAVSMGARIIEKHFTLDKNYSDFRDHRLSADPAEMKSMVKTIRDIEILMGTGIKEPRDAEKKELQNNIRRFIVAKINLMPGHIVSTNDITWLRIKGELPAGMENNIIGRKITKGIAAGEPVSMNHFN